jgi:predicted transcriptional regulator
MWNDDGAITEERLAEIFYSPIRSKTLLFIAAAGVTNLSTIYDALKLGSVSAMYAIEHWERQGIIRSKTHRKHRLITLDERFPVAGELHAFLEALIRNSAYYQRLGKWAHQRMEQVRSMWVKPPRDEHGRLRYRLTGR